MSQEQGQNGGSNNFYDIPDWVENVDDLNEYLKSTGPMSNILKSLFSSLGERHKGTSERRDAKKILHYSIRHLLWLDRREDKSLTELDILAELIAELPKIKRGELLERVLTKHGGETECQ
ncbi:MAG: hypothetical protein DRN14_05345 [Thermoplasmata archaeon]|nr:MAG: hypothetical protein DRN14_05345 [Thermoplasmata archaeon]